MRGYFFTLIFADPNARWSHWTQLPADEELKFVKEYEFPFIKTLGGEGGAVATHMGNAEIKVSKAKWQRVIRANNE